MIGALAVTVATSLAWFAVYRFPLAGVHARARVGMAVGSALGWSAKAGFTAFATLWYVVFGAAAVVVQAVATGVGPSQLVGTPPVGTAVWAFCLSLVGAVSWIGIWMSVVRTLSPSLDIPATVTGVRWVRDSLVVKPSLRWIVPLTGAVVEETFYRGTVFVGLRDSGFAVLPAALVATALFTLTQMGMTQTWAQAAILAASSVVVSAFGCLLVVTTSSIVPAIALHASFAAFYSRSSWTLAQIGPQGRTS